MAENAPYLGSGKYINRLRTLFRAVYYFLGVGGLGVCFVLLLFFFCFVLFCFLAKKISEILQEGNRGLEASELP